MKASVEVLFTGAPTEASTKAFMEAMESFEEVLEASTEFYFHESLGLGLG